MPLPLHGLAQLVEHQSHNPVVLGLPGQVNIVRDDFIGKRSCSVASQGWLM